MAFAIREMRITEEQFWEMTPRKFYWLMQATVKVAADMNPFVPKSSESSTTKTHTANTTTIDKLPGWD